MSLPNKKILYLNAVLLGAVLSFAIYRDFQNERQFPTDLRNRVVGARLQHDHIGPYTYYWKPADSTRYFDPANYNTDAQHASNITASPFFHEIFYPLARLPQRTVSRIWCWLQYLFLASIIGMLCTLTTDKTKKWIIINLGILFTVTEAWKEAIAVGQLYFFEGFLMSCILFLMISKKKSGFITGGILAAAFVLTRPYALVIFIPFFFDYKKYFPFLAASFTVLLFYGLYALFNSNEKAIYADYIKGMRIQVMNHQNGNPEPPSRLKPGTVFTYNIPELEGFRFEEVYRFSKEHPLHISSESGNVFVIYYLLMHKSLPTAVLYACFLFALVLVTGLFFLNTWKYPPDTLKITLFGCTLYMMAELFSPIYRHQYNAVQWLPLILTAVLGLPGQRNFIFLLIIAGLFLNIINTSWLPMRHTLGEFCWLLALLLTVFSFRLNIAPWKKQ